MQRFALSYLKDWISKPNRKPLIVRGARQVGKSYLVRDFGKKYFDNIIEINFEQDQNAGALFASNSPDKIIKLLELHSNKPITPGKTLLFLDEIQVAPPVIAALRFFYEQKEYNNT